MNEDFEIKLKRSKDAWFSAEKMRKKKWEKKKIDKIKKMTVQSLEPELNRMMKTHKNEIKKLEEMHVEEMRRLKAYLFQIIDEK